MHAFSSVVASLSNCHAQAKGGSLHITMAAISGQPLTGTSLTFGRKRAVHKAQASAARSPKAPQLTVHDNFAQSACACRCCLIIGVRCASPSFLCSCLCLAVFAGVAESKRYLRSLPSLRLPEPVLCCVWCLSLLTAAYRCFTNSLCMCKPAVMQ